MLIGNLLLAGALALQGNLTEVGQLLGSGRSDLWVFGIDQDARTGSVEVQIQAITIPPERWEQLDSRPLSGKVLFAQHPSDWNWKERPARQLYGEHFYHLSKYDEFSSFSPCWGASVVDGKVICDGAILRAESGRLKLIPNGLEQARADYGLSPSQSFLGLVNDNVFFFDKTHPEEIFFFAKASPNLKFSILVPQGVFQGRSWKLDEAYQVFASDTPSDILIVLKERNHALISMSPRVSTFGTRLNLSSAKPIRSNLF